MSSSRPRLYLIDAYSNIFRAFYAIRNLSNSRGEPTNAVFGFVQILRKLVKDHRPDLVGVAWDLGEPTVRSDKFADYKANRAPTPEDLKPQIPWVREVLTAFRIPILELENYEADDVLGTLAKKASEEGYDVVLVSADKDLMQLVGPHVWLYHTGRDKLYDEAGVTEDFGVPPAKVADVLALMGDAVDNIPGVPGIGEKGAKSLIAEHGSLPALLERASEVNRKAYREGLLNHKADALLSLELATIHTQLPVPFEPELLRLDPPDVEALRGLYSRFEFKTLLAELGTPEAERGSRQVRELETAEAWEAAVAGLSAKVLALAGEERPFGLAVAAEEDESPVYFADFRRPHLRERVLALLAADLTDPAARWVGHDLKEVLRLLPSQGRGAKARLTDLMLLSYVLRSASDHGLGSIAGERLGAAPAKAAPSKGGEPLVGDPGNLAAVGERVSLIARLAPLLETELGDGPLATVYHELEEPLLAVLVAMEETGILLDVPFLAEMSRQLAADLSRLETEIYDLAGESFNIQSPQQLGVILFEKLGYPSGKKTKKTKNFATGAEVLEGLAAQGYPLPERILRYRELAKLKSTYVDALPALVGADGRLHTRFHQAVAATGRLSSANPNLQNIPVRTELGQRIRRAFVAAPGHQLLVADYSQIELRVLAHIAEEGEMIEAFRRGEDIHRSTAATVFHVAPELVTAEMRRAAKTINFGIIYGISGFGLAQNLGGLSPKEADRFIHAYLDRYAGVRRYMEETLSAAQKEGRVATLYGRLRYLPDIHSPNWNLKENARRMAINARIQGTAADLMKKAMIAVDRRLAAEQPASRLLLTVHDELVLEVPEADLAAVSALVKAEMEGVAELKVPLVVDVASGASWYEAKSA